MSVVMQIGKERHIESGANYDVSFGGWWIVGKWKKIIIIIVFIFFFWILLCKVP